MSHAPSDWPDCGSGTTELSESERHRLLAAERRRTLLGVLAERETPVELDELVAAIAAREDEPALPDDEFEWRVEISLHHWHLPLMADVGAIDYDPTSARVESVRSPVDVLPP